MDPSAIFPELQAEDYHDYLCSIAEMESSYDRCHSLKVPVGLTKPQKIMPKDTLAPLLVMHSLLLTASEQVIAPVCCRGPHKNCIYILCDPDLVALKIFAAPEVLAAAKETSIMPGTAFTEESCGVNALALAREQNRLVAVKGEQHYCRLFKEWLCVASQVKDSQDSILGYLDISMHEHSQLELSIPMLEFLLCAIKRDLNILTLSCVSYASEEILSVLPSGTGGLSASVLVDPLLTLREKEVLLLLASRLTSGEMAEELNLSIETIKTHRRNIHRKLGIEKVREFIRSNRHSK